MSNLNLLFGLAAWIGLTAVIYVAVTWHSNLIKRESKKPETSVMHVDRNGRATKVVWGETQEPVGADFVPWVKIGETGSPACPDCGCEKFREGPSGGACINIQCGDCEQKWNYTGMFLIGGKLMIARI